MADHTPAATIWINAFNCVRPSDEFAAEVGREVISRLMQEGQPKVSWSDPFRRIVIEVTCS